MSTSLPYRHILVTGGAGFIGSHFIRLLLAEDPAVRVTNVDKLTYAASLANLASVQDDPRYRFLQADIADDSVREVLRQDPPDALVNFAAETHVDRSIAGAADFVRTDVLGTQNLLDGAREVGVRRFVQVGTDEVYGSIATGAATEEFPLRPGNPYSASKAGADLMCLAYHNTYDLPVLLCRGANTYGPNQYPEKLIPLAVTNVLLGLPIPLYGDGHQRRDWLYVRDHCRGILTVLCKGEAGEIYNIAGEQERENREMVSRLLAELGAPADRLIHLPDRPGHDRRYAMSSAKLRGLGWRPQMPLDAGLRETVAWYRNHEDWWRAIRAGAPFRAYFARQYPTQ